jgi:hypothetical protein
MRISISCACDGTELTVIFYLPLLRARLGGGYERSTQTSPDVCSPSCYSLRRFSNDPQGYLCGRSNQSLFDPVITRLMLYVSDLFPLEGCQHKKMTYVKLHNVHLLILQAMLLLRYRLSNERLDISLQFL